MCGIAGVVDASGACARRATRSHADARARCALRGPDDAGTLHRRHGACSAHRRLSIIDLAGGHQPMATPDGALHRRLQRRDLQLRRAARAARGARAPLRHALRHRGASSTPIGSGATTASRELDGMFAFALWDARAAPPAPGARSLRQEAALLFSPTARGWSFASTLTALLQHPRGAARARPRRARRVPGARVRGRAAHHRRAACTSSPPATRLVFDADRRRADDVALLAAARRRRALRGRPSEDAAQQLEALPARGGEEAAGRRRAARHLPLGRHRLLDGGGAGGARARAASRPSRSRFADPSFDESGYARTRRRAPRHRAPRGGAVARRGGEDRRRVSATSSTSRWPTARSSRPTCCRASRAATSRSRSAATAATSCSPAIRPTWRTAWSLLAGPAGAPARWCGRPRRWPRACRSSHDNFSFDFKLKKLLGGAARSAATSATTVWLGAFEPARVAALLGDGVARDAVRRRARALPRADGGPAPRARALPGRRALPVPLGAGQGRPRLDGGVARGARAASRHRGRRVRRRAAARRGSCTA